MLGLIGLSVMWRGRTVNYDLATGYRTWQILPCKRRIPVLRTAQSDHIGRAFR